MNDAREQIEKVISNFFRCKIVFDPGTPMHEHSELALTLARIVYDVVYPHLYTGDTPLKYETFEIWLKDWTDREFENNGCLPGAISAGPWKMVWKAARQGPDPQEGFTIYTPTPIRCRVIKDGEELKSTDWYNTSSGRWDQCRTGVIYRGGDALFVRPL